jgi:hypothetical protein
MSGTASTIAFDTVHESTAARMKRHLAEAEKA